MKKAVSLFAGFIFVSNISAQTCEDAIVSSAPESRYQDNGDGTVTDLYHGLVWKRCSEGQGGSDCNLGTATTHTWQGALQLVDALNTSGGYAGNTDWRLPNIKELASLVEVQCTDPAINEALFPGTQSTFYWTSSPKFFDIAMNDDSLSINFLSGTHTNAASRGNSNYVRVVRGP